MNSVHFSFFSLSPALYLIPSLFYPAHLCPFCQSVLNDPSVILTSVNRTVGIYGSILVYFICEFVL
jgi:hypothetical protein